jgi:hypothetical protein
MKNAILSLLILFGGFFCSAQTLHIAQDISHCAFGLKNDSDQWVVQPAYPQIKPAYSNTGTNLRYSAWITSDGIHFGLLDSSGVVVFPPRFNDVKSFFAIPEKNIFEPKQKPKIGTDSILYIPEYCDYYKVKEGYLFFFAYNHEGFADSLGNVLTDKLYYSVDYFHYGYAKVTVAEDDHSGAGFINENGKEIIPAEYDDVSPATKFGVYVSGKSRTGFISWSDGKFTPMKMRYFRTLSGDSVFIGSDGDKFSLLGNHGNFLSKGEYDTIMVNYNYSKDSRVCILKENGKTGLFAVTGKVLLDVNCDSIEYEKLDSYDNGRFYVVHVNRNAFFKRNGKWGMISDSLGIIIKPSFSAAGWLNDKREFCWTLKGKQFHAFKINNSRAEEIPFGQLFAMNSSGDFMTLTGALQTFEVDRNGKLIGKPFPWTYFQDDEYVFLPDQFQSIKGKSGVGIARLEDDSIIVPPIFKTASIFGKFFSYYHENRATDDGNFYVETFGGHYGVYSQEGRKIVDTVYTTLTSYDSDNFCWIGKRDSSSWDLIRWNPVYAQGWDPTIGKIVATSNSEFKKTFSNGLFVIDENGSENLYDLQNEKYIAENKFKKIEPIENGYFIVTTDNDGTGLMDDRGEIVIDTIYSDITSPSSGILILSNNDEYGLADLAGNILLPLSEKSFAFRNVALDTIIDPGSIYFDGDAGVNVSLADTAYHFDAARIANNFLLDLLISMQEYPRESYDNNYYSVERITIGDENVYYYDVGSQETDYSLDGVSKCSFTLSFYSSYWHGGGGSSDLKMNTYLIRKDSIVEIGLYDILRSDISLQPLNDSIREMISSSDDSGSEFFFDCSNPEELSPDYFSVTNDGIVFTYINKNEEGNEEYSKTILEITQSVTLTWKQLDKFIRSDSDFKNIYCKKKK